MSKTYGQMVSFADAIAWAERSANWYKACDRIAEYAGVGLAWGGEK